MKRSELEHVIRASAQIADDDELIIIGSQAILGQFPDAPEELCVSNERDKDQRFTRALVKHGLAERGTLLERLAATDVDEARRTRALGLIDADFSALR